MNPYFSTSRIRSLEPLIQNLVNKLCHRLKEYRNTGKPINIHHAYICFTTDVVSGYTMGVGFHYLDEPGFVPEWNETLTTSAKASVYMRPFPWLRCLLDALPERVLLRIFPEAILTAQFKRRCENIMQSIIDEQSSKNYDRARSEFSHPTFFHDVLSSSLPLEEKSPERLSQEVRLVIGAGSESTSKMLAWTTFYLLENKKKLDKLREELNRLDPEYTASLVDFEQMPYLTSVMLEGLSTLQFKEWTIPAGTPVEMTSVLMHHNEEIFPDSYSFIPERWIDLCERKRLEKYMVSFSKGSRQCLGMNLAKAEILLLLPKILREFEFELFETTREDVTIAHDLFLPYPREDSKGVRVLIH
ncbi:cytochrome P450 [Aspergillus melleus]|uniref:cytochrome P450 n=1 Tax=Aspergillus melleus TaxID=138277 RepID=UPI001E8D5E2F|nr:uncharacterized protein LDX57_007422 [Aspergillus melleus]KAH8429750.1 hypothetical protein LDX57_007422 [Aspergillus melleus]